MTRLRITLVCAIALVALLAMSAAAFAAPTVYANDFAGWSAAVGGNYSTEDFADATLNADLSYTSTTGWATITGGKFYDRLQAGTTTWSFAGPQYAFGGKWDLTPGGPGTGIKVLVDGSWTLIGEIPNTYAGEFWGFVTTEPFTAVRLEMGTNPYGVAETYYLDDLVYGGRWVKTNEAKISEDLVAQTDTICIPAMVKVHPTLQLAIDKASLSYFDLNPATNPSVDLTCTVQVKSNLPFRQQVTVAPFNFYSNPEDLLESYEYVDGVWTLTKWDPELMGPEPGTGDTIPAEMQSVYIQMVNGVTGAAYGSEALVGSNGVFPAYGTIGDIDNHIWESNIRWHVGPINWCVTAGYYTGQLCVTVYQN